MGRAVAQVQVHARAPSAASAPVPQGPRTLAVLYRRLKRDASARWTAKSVPKRFLPGQPGFGTLLRWRGASPRLSFLSGLDYCSRMFRWLQRAKKVAPQEPPNRTADVSLLDVLLKTTTARFEAQMAHEDRLLDLDLKKRELELANIERITAAEIEARRAKVELRREAKGRMAELRGRRKNGQQLSFGECPVCRDPASPALTAMQIMTHRQEGHGTPPQEQ